jgi:hypothetical protein
MYMFYLRVVGQGDGVSYTCLDVLQVEVSGCS